MNHSFRQTKLYGFLKIGEDLGRFLEHSMGRAEAVTLLEQARERREERFLEVLRQAVFANHESPYRPLFRAAGFDEAAVGRLVVDLGLERALETLRVRGVVTSLRRFKGTGTTAAVSGVGPVDAAAFDLARRGLAGTTGGSSGRPVLDIALLEHEAAAQRLFLEAFDLLEHPIAVWRPVAPGLAGIKKVLQHLKLGLPVERWFSQYRPPLHGAGLEDRLLQWAYRLHGVAKHQGVPTPEYVPAERAETVARWMANRVTDGRPVHLDTTASCGVRVAQAACRHGWSLEGCFFRVGGEPLTSVKRSAIEDSGARVGCHYALSEVGIAGIACARPAGVDDVHLLDDKVVVQPEGTDDGEPQSLFCTSLLSHSPKLLINVELGDRAFVRRRDCGCAVGAFGYAMVASSITSYESVTTEGLALSRPVLEHLVEVELPRAFGGTVGQYQLRELERDGLPRLQLSIAPEVGPVDDERVVRFMLAWLGRRGERLARAQWGEGGSFEVVRRLPEVTGAAKVLPYVRDPSPSPR